MEKSGSKTERFLVHPKGGPPGDHLEWPWMEGIPSKAPARTAGILAIILDHLEWSKSKVHPCTQAICSVQVTEKRRGLPPGPDDPSWMERIPSNAPGAPAGSFQDILGYLEWSRRKVPNGLQEAGCRECPGRQAEEVPHHQRRLRISRTTRGPAPPGLLWDWIGDHHYCVCSL